MHHRYLSLALRSFLLPIVIAVTPSFGQTESPDTATADTTAQSFLDTIVPPQPVTNLIGKDNPNDDGGEVYLDWEKASDDIGDGRITGYRILRADSPDGPFTEVGDRVAGATDFTGGDTEDGRDYYFKVETISAVTSPDGELVEVTTDSDVIGPIHSSPQWFDASRINVLVATVLVVFFILYMIYRAKKGGELYIRKIAGLEAVDEAVGRATEMGRKIYFVPGIQDMDNVQTIAGVIILGHVAGLAAQYDTYLDVPVCRSLVLVTAKEVLKEAYSKAGRPDSYQENQVHYLTDDQFGYAAGIDGMVVREKPATIFYMGAFFAESLILAETGNASGAIQIAGTAMPAQLPFFVTACDYTLIGEELFAASAYLSKEPRLLGSLKGQDYAKAAALIAIVVGAILETFHIWEFSQILSLN